jgi:hypothetical protein
MRTRTRKRAGNAGWGAAGLLAGLLLLGCSPARPSLPDFPAYAPAEQFIERQEQLQQQYSGAADAHESRYWSGLRLEAERSRERWRIFEASVNARLREQQLLQEIRRRNEEQLAQANRDVFRSATGSR